MFRSIVVRFRNGVEGLIEKGIADIAGFSRKRQNTGFEKTAAAGYLLVRSGNGVCGYAPDN